MDVLHARELRVLESPEALLEDDALVEETRAAILEGDVFVARGGLDPVLLASIRDYLAQVGRSSLPAYHRIEEGAPDHHRVNRADPRSYVEGVFHQFSFFPWNHGVFDLFSIFEPVYRIKNRLSGLPERRFLGQQPEEGCIARVSFQFYPRGVGRLNLHADPVDRHQLVLPTVMMSTKGEDFEQGGLVVSRADGSLVDVDAVARLGDIVYFNARIVHGVRPIDPGTPEDWLSFRGRWMALLAVNRLFDNRSIGDAQDLERGLAPGGA